MASRRFAQDHIRRCENHVGRCGSEGTVTVAGIVHPASTTGTVSEKRVRLLPELTPSSVYLGFGGHHRLLPHWFHDPGSTCVALRLQRY